MKQTIKQKSKSNNSLSKKYLEQREILNFLRKRDQINSLLIGALINQNWDHKEFIIGTFIKQNPNQAEHLEKV